MANKTYGGGANGYPIDNGIVDADRILYEKVASGVVRAATRAAVVGNILDTEQSWSAAQTFNAALIAMGNVGVGTATPGVNIVGTFDYPSTVELLQVDGDSARVVIRGSTDAALVLIDSGAGTNVKMGQFTTINGTTRFLSVNDDGTVNTDNIITLDHATGAVGVTGNLTVGGLIFDNEAMTAYDTGTWVPAVTGSTGNPTITYTTQVGKYTRIGNVVCFSFVIVINAFSGGTGNLRVSLPIAVANDSVADWTRNGVVLSGVDIPGTSAGLAFVPNGGASLGTFYVINDNAAAAIIEVTACATTDTIAASGFYFA